MRNMALMVAFLLSVSALADGIRDNDPTDVRPVPPRGIPIPADVRESLDRGLDALSGELSRTAKSVAGKPGLLDLLADAEVYHKAVRYAVEHDELFHEREFAIAEKLLEQGLDRCRTLRDGKAPWAEDTGLVVRAYRSKIDASVQPYGLVIPPSYRPNGTHRYRLDCWFHGRGEKLSELSFIQQCQSRPGQFVPENAIVLHLYGRYCNANKFAGEIDLLEALESVRSSYPIDEDRIVVRGFSMGGAACWQFAVHYAGRWVAAAPGAGFSETPEFLDFFQKEKLDPFPWQRVLWHWYDCTDYAANLYNCPTVAYSGELDIQKQAADIMARALAREGIPLTHIIGPETRHSYHPDAKREIDRRIDAIVRRGRDPVPRRVRFTTWTLRYDSMLWVRIDGLREHWKKARLDAEILDDHSVRVSPENVSAFTLAMPSGHAPFDPSREVVLRIDGSEALRGAVPRVQSDRSWTIHVAADDGERWTITDAPRQSGKRHGLQGPIDDAFLDSFIMVQPTGQASDPKVEAWVRSESRHAIDHWRSQFRGDARSIRDLDVTSEIVSEHNLILWGTPESNSVLAGIADRLPLERLPSPAMSHVPVLIYPNPLNPDRYVVLNSGFTFREYDYLNNARQVPRLPDWAVIDVTVPPTSQWPGRVVDAGFFDEEWRLRK